MNLAPQAHIVSSSPPSSLAWTLSVLLGSGIVAVVLLRDRRWRWVAGFAAAGAGLATVLTSVIGSGGPQPPVRGISTTVEPLSGPPGRFLVSVCVPGPPRAGAAAGILLVSVDGAQVTEGTASSFSVSLTPGRHTVRVELLTQDHRAYSPAVASETVVDSALPAVGATPLACPL